MLSPPLSQLPVVTDLWLMLCTYNTYSSMHHLVISLTEREMTVLLMVFRIIPSGFVNTLVGNNVENNDNAKY